LEILFEGVDPFRSLTLPPSFHLLFFAAPSSPDQPFKIPMNMEDYVRRYQSVPIPAFRTIGLPSVSPRKSDPLPVFHKSRRVLLAPMGFDPRKMKRMTDPRGGKRFAIEPEMG